MIDTNCWWGAWPLGGGAATTVTGAPSGRELAETLAGHGIGEAWVSALGAVWAAEPMTSNRELAAVVDGVEGLRVVPVINPVLPGWEEDVAEVATWAGVRAVRLLPAYHGYRLGAARWRAAAARVAATGLKLVVTVRLVDERHEHHAVRVKPVGVAELRRWLVGLGEAVPLVQGLTRRELDGLAMGGVTNFYADLSFAEWQETLRVVTKKTASRRLMLGTLTPLHVTAAQVAKIAGPARVAAGAGNARRFLQ